MDINNFSFTLPTDPSAAPVDNAPPTADRSNLATLTAALGNPNVQNYLHMIASSEGTTKAADPYSQGFGNTTISDLSAHPGTQHSFTQTDGKKNVTTAAGAYQFIKPTWDGIQKALNLPDFGPQSQDLGAVYLMQQNGSLSDVLNGNFNAAVQKDGSTWASLPSSPYPQSKRSQAFIDQALAQTSGGGIILNANAADAPGADTEDLTTIPAPKLIDAYQRASDAQDPEAMQQIAGALGPRLQQGLQLAQTHNDADAISQIQGMMAKVGMQSPGATGHAPQAAQGPQGVTLAPGSQFQMPGAAPSQPNPQAPAQSAQPAQPVQPVPGTSDNVGPPVALKNPSTLQALGNLASQVANHPLKSAGNALVGIGQGVVNLADQAVHHPLNTINGAVRGVADGLTFGGADKLAALANSQMNGTSYEDELLKQRQADQDSGTAFTAGQLATPLLPGGAVSLAGKATEMVPTASTAARALTGAGAGAVEGAANYLGHNDGPVDGSNLATNAVIGGALGPLAAAGGPTQSQRASTFLRGAGGDVANAQRDAEIIGGLQGLASRSTQGKALLGPADANALANRYTQEAGDAVRQLGNGPDQQQLLTALNRTRSLTDDDIDAIRQLPNGDAVADAIQMKQRALAMTAPTPANTGALASATRMLVDNGALSAVGHMIHPGLGFALGSKPVRTFATALAGGRENRTGNIADALGQATNAQAFLQQYGPSQAAKSAQGLAQLSQSAQAARQAVLQAQQSARVNSTAANYLKRGQQAALLQRANIQAATLPTAATQMQAASVVQAGQQAAQQVRTGLGLKAAQAAQQAQAAQAVSNVAQGNFAGLDLNKPALHTMLGYVDHPGMPEVQQSLSKLAAQDPATGQSIVQLLTPGGANLPQSQYYGLQKALQDIHGAKVPANPAGAPVAPGTPGVLGSLGDSPVAQAIQNPMAYQAAITRRQSMVDHAVSNAPSSAMASIAHQMGAASSPELKQQAFDAAMAKASPEEQRFLRDHVQPLIRYGK